MLRVLRGLRLLHTQVLIGGDGSLIPVYLHDLPLQIGNKLIRAPVGFSERLGVAFNLLGRLGVFEHFTICFREKQKTISFQSVK